MQISKAFEDTLPWREVYTVDDDGQWQDCWKPCCRHRETPTVGRDWNSHYWCAASYSGRTGRHLQVRRENLDISKSNFANEDRSSGGRVVKHLACGARGPGFDSRPRHLNFQRLVISCFQVEIWLKDSLIDVIPQNNQPTKAKEDIFFKINIILFYGQICISFHDKLVKLCLKCRASCRLLNLLSSTEDHDCVNCLYFVFGRNQVPTRSKNYKTNQFNQD